MKVDAIRVYVIRTPLGWWRRGSGARKGGTHKHLKWATLYRNKGAASTAALHVPGKREVVEILMAIGDVVFRCES